MELLSTETNHEKHQKLDALCLDSTEWAQTEDFVKILEVRVFFIVEHFSHSISHGLVACVSSPTLDRKSTRLNSSHSGESRMPSSA